MQNFIMISQPMNGLTKEQIVANREHTINILNDEGWVVLDTIVDIDELKGHKHDAVRCLAESIKFMSNVDAIYFLKGWENARGCKIEHEIAKQYGVNIIYE